MQKSMCLFCEEQKNRNISIVNKSRILAETDNFVVYEDGTLKAVNGIFSGTIYATAVKSAMVFDGDSAVLIGRELGIGPDATPEYPENGNFYVDANGNVNMEGDIFIEGYIDVNNYGELGYVTGSTAVGNTTTGIGMQHNSGTQIVVTNAGARMSADTSKVVVTKPGESDNVDGSEYAGSVSLVHDKASLKLESKNGKDRIVYKSDLTGGSWRNLEYAYFA